MIGTIFNIITVLLGGILGTFLGGKLPERLRQTVVAGLGLLTVGYGIREYLKTQNSILIIVSLLVGAILGEWWQIEERLQSLGSWLEMRFAGTSSAQSGTENRFVRGFITSSLVFCVGPMTILGAIQDGLTGNYSMLAIKSIMDGFGAIAFASSMGVGVLFSTIVILVYQGGISLLAGQVQSFITEAMMREMSAAGGVILLGIGISSLLEIKKIRCGSFLPALFIAPLIVAVLTALGIGF